MILDGFRATAVENRRSRHGDQRERSRIALRRFRRIRDGAADRRAACSRGTVEVAAAASASMRRAPGGPSPWRPPRRVQGNDGEAAGVREHRRGGRSRPVRVFAWAACSAGPRSRPAGRTPLGAAQGSSTSGSASAICTDSNGDGPDPRRTRSRPVQAASHRESCSSRRARRRSLRRRGRLIRALTRRRAG